METENNKDILISFICGSLSKNGKTKMALSVAQKGSKEFNATSWGL
jgi:hypothetical protein